MNPDNALKTISNMKEWGLRKNISLLLVGSVGYRSALLHPEMLKYCDDIDCIFIYDDIMQIAGCPILDERFFETACDTIPSSADMFAVKAERNGIRISADFVSGRYLHELGKEQITGESKFRLKLTNATEVPDNVYCNFYGERTTYHKICYQYSDYRIYKLPIHYFMEGVFFPGVLFSKYVFNPTAIIMHETHQSDIAVIQTIARKLCPSDGSLCLAYHRATDFSEETKAFLESLKIERN